MEPLAGRSEADTLSIRTRPQLNQYTNDIEVMAKMAADERTATARDKNTLVGIFGSAGKLSDAIALFVVGRRGRTFTSQYL